MFDKITFVTNEYIIVKLIENMSVKENILNMHVVIADTEKYLLGEIIELKGLEVKIMLLGEFLNGELKSGILRKPLLNAQIRTVINEEIPLILGKNDNKSFMLGTNPYYNNLPVYVNIDKFFGGHFVILGNSGSGKTYSVASLIQSLFKNDNVLPVKSNFIIFDVSGEYSKALDNINTINPNYNYRMLSTNHRVQNAENLIIPPWILTVDDYCLLLRCNSHSQKSIVERMIRLAKIFASNGNDANKYKNHLIAKAIISILYSDESASKKRDDIFTIVENCKTSAFNLFATIQGIGYTRSFQDCFLIDKQGQFSESILITQYVSSFIDNRLDNFELPSNVVYTLEDLTKALDFTLISDGWFKNENTYADGMLIKVRLNELLSDDYKSLFTFDAPVTDEEYIVNMMMQQGQKYQIVNINFDGIDDSVAGVITKIFTRLIFDFSKKVNPRGSIPFHLIVEEAHRYVKQDNDEYMIGYNIFERVAKEGRKYGVLLGIISQRPVEMSDVVISQAMNFLIFKTNHPKDFKYIKEMIPNINAETIEKQKTLQSGTCIAFGTAFKVPTIINIPLPNPAPVSENNEIIKYWT